MPALPVDDAARGEHQCGRHRIENFRHQHHSGQATVVVAAGLPALGHDHLGTVADGLLRRFHSADLLPNRDAGIEQQLQMIGRRMTPVEGSGRHFLFRTDADLGVIVEEGDEIDIERCVGRRADLVDDGSEGFGRREAHANRPDPAACADREGEVRSAACEGHAGAGERMTAAEPLRHTRRDAARLIRDPPLAEVGQAQW